MFTKSLKTTAYAITLGAGGLVFPYNDRAMRVKVVVDPDGLLTKKIRFSPKNKLEDIRCFAEIGPTNEVNGKPFAVLSRQVVEREKDNRKTKLALL